MKLLHKAYLIGFLAFFLSGCSAHYHINTQAVSYDSANSYHFENLAQNNNSDELFVCLAFSGGGTRAAAFSYGVLKELKNTTITINGEQKSLLDEVDCISGISGGSFTAAYYGAFRDQIFADYRSQFLDRDIQQEIMNRVLFNPKNWLRLMSTTFDRIDLAIELYDQEIFVKNTFNTFAENGRPYVMINATNLENGSQFSFTADYFDALGSQLNDYPIGSAVAASSAFPFLLSPISLYNYPTAENYSPPGWYEGALKAKNADRDRYMAGKNLQYYLDDKSRRYIHLMDGGLADNIGIRAIYNEYSRGFIRKRINNNSIAKLVIIVVNAKTEPEQTYSQNEDRPGLAAVSFKTATISMDNYSYETITVLAKALNDRIQAQKNIKACQKKLDQHCPTAPKLPAFGANIDPYIVELNFNDIDGIEGEDPQYYTNLPTSFSLTTEQVDKLIGIVPKLLTKNTPYQCLLQVIEAEANAKPRPEQCKIGSGISGY